MAAEIPNRMTAGVAAPHMAQLHPNTPQAATLASCRIPISNGILVQEITKSKMEELVCRTRKEYEFHFIVVFIILHSIHEKKMQCMLHKGQQHHTQSARTQIRSKRNRITLQWGMLSRIYRNGTELQQKPQQQPVNPATSLHIVVIIQPCSE